MHRHARMHTSIPLRQLILTCHSSGHMNFVGRRSLENLYGCRQQCQMHPFIMHQWAQVVSVCLWDFVGAVLSISMGYRFQMTWKPLRCFLIGHVSALVVLKSTARLTGHLSNLQTCSYKLQSFEGPAVGLSLWQTLLFAISWDEEVKEVKRGKRAPSGLLFWKPASWRNRDFPWKNPEKKMFLKFSLEIKMKILSRKVHGDQNSASSCL